MTDPTPQPIGWYADPAGRYQYRYWDGTRWTERVAREGVEAVDSPVGEVRPPRPPAAAGSPHRGRVIAALAILLLALVGTTIWVLGPKRHHDQASQTTTTQHRATTTTPTTALAGSVVAPGAGMVTLAVDRGTFKVQQFHLLAGQTAVIGWHVQGTADVRIGISSATVDQLSDRQYIGPPQRTTALQDAESLLTDLPSLAPQASTLSDNDPTLHIGAFQGVVLGPPDTLVAPVEGDFAVIVAGTVDKTTVQLNIAVRGEPTVTGNLRAPDYNDLVAGPFRDAVNRFVLAYCNAYPNLDHGACDRLQTDTDGWAGTGADPAPDITSSTDTGSGSGSASSTSTTRRSSSTTTTTR